MRELLAKFSLKLLAGIGFLQGCGGASGPSETEALGADRSGSGGEIFDPGGSGGTGGGGPIAAESGGAGAGGLGTGGLMAGESGGAGTGGSVATGACEGSLATPGGYCVVGNKIFPVGGGEAIIFRGVNIGFLHDSLTGHHHAHINEYIEVRAWGSNVVRIPIDQTWWLANEGGGYRARLDEFVGWATDSELAVIIDVHRSGGGSDEGKATAETLKFWQAFAPLYKDNGQLILELYNEPRGITNEQLWRGGNGVAGIQQMYDAIRAAGSHQIILIGGNDWGYDLRGWNDYPLDDGHYNIVFSAHPYSYNGKDTVDEFQKDFAFLASDYPFILTEFGYAPTTPENTHDAFDRLVIDFCEQNGLGWTAWAWTDYFINHSIFERQSSYDPANRVFAPLTSHGQIIKEALAP